MDEFYLYFIIDLATKVHFGLCRINTYN